MLKERMVINDCYILQSRIGEDSYTEHWIATAIFSATEFLLRFLKGECEGKGLAADFRHDAIKSYQVQGLQIEDFIEIESFEGRTFISSEYLCDFFVRCCNAMCRIDQQNDNICFLHS